MAYFPKTSVYLANSPSIDAFDRLRVSNPYTVFDSKQLYDKGSLFWDESITTGAGSPTSTHSTTNASVTMTVTGSGDIIARQTYMRFNYQPGKSTLIFLTASLTTTSNVKARVGAFRGDTTATAPAGSNGIFFEADSGTIYVVKRKNGTDTRVAQASWNLDTMDGSGPSGITIDPTKVQIMVIDYEWLGVGRIRMGFVVDGLVNYCHEFNHANTNTSVYMSTPNVPLRYEISSSGGSSSLQHICSSVMIEGGVEENGLIRSVSTGVTHVDANVEGTYYALIGLRLKTTHLDASVHAIKTSILSETNDNILWQLRFNPTVAGTFTYNDVSNSPVQYATGATANTVTSGSVIDQGYLTATSGILSTLTSVRRLGASISGTRDQLVLCCTPLGGGSSNSDVQAALTWRELL